MTTEASRKCCKYCGNPFHRGWQCKQNPKNQAKLSKTSTSTVPKRSTNLSLKQTKKRKKSSRSKLIREYDALFSRYLRAKAQRDKQLFCFVCGKRLTYDTAVVMHFVSRRFISVRFDEDNVHVGCRKCNTPDKDQPKVLQKYAELLGEKVVSDLNQRKQNKISTPELQAQFEAFKLKVKQDDLLLPK